MCQHCGAPLADHCRICSLCLCFCDEQSDGPGEDAYRPLSAEDERREIVRRLSQ